MADAASAATALDRLGGPAGLAQRLADGPSPRPSRHRHEGVGRGEVVGESAPPEGDVATDVLDRAAFDGRPPAGGSQVAGGVGGRKVHGRLEHAAPTGAAAQVGQKAPGGLVLRDGAAPRRGGQADDDPGRAEPALAGAGGDEGVGPPVSLGRRDSLDGRDAPAGDPPGRRHTGHPGGAVDEHGAAAALALRAAPILHAAQPETVAQHLEERRAVLGNLDLAAVDLQRQGHGWRLRGSRSAGSRRATDRRDGD